jgi:hypothetical protein
MEKSYAFGFPVFRRILTCAWITNKSADKACLLKQDIRAISVTETIDAKPEGKLLETVLAGFAQFR